MHGDIHKTDNSDADIEAVHVVTLNCMRGNLHKQCCDRISINILSHCVVSRANAPKLLLLTCPLVVPHHI